MTGIPRTFSDSETRSTQEAVPIAERRRPRRRTIAGVLLTLALLVVDSPARAEATLVQTPYGEQKVVFDFYFDDPAKIDSALYWVRALLNPLMGEPYGYAPESLDLIVLIHGTEIVTTVKHNYERYRDAVERMRYYASLGIRFRVCGLAAEDYGYKREDFHDFIEIAPSAVTELAHWQLQGYALIRPEIMEKRYAIEEIR